MGRHFLVVGFFQSILDEILKICYYFEEWRDLTMVFIKFRNAVKISDKMTFCAVQFSPINIRHLTDSGFKWVGGRGFSADDLSKVVCS